MNKYIKIPVSELPDGLLWVTPRRMQGQTVEVSYSGAPCAANRDADDGDPWKRVHDRSNGEITYYRRKS